MLISHWLLLIFFYDVIEQSFTCNPKVPKRWKRLQSNETAKINNHIVGRYISSAVPCPSGSTFLSAWYNHFLSIQTNESADSQALNRISITVPPKLASLLSRVTGTFLSRALSLSCGGETDEWETATTEGDQASLFFDSPSVCAVCSRLFCSVWLSRCPRPSALPRWTGPGGTSWAGQPDTGGTAAPTSACWDRRGGGAPRNACDESEGRRLSRLKTWGSRVVMVDERLRKT